MVGGLGVAGVAAVVGGDHQDIAGAHFAHKAGQPVVELGSGGGVARNVAAMAVQHVKVHQIDKGKPLKVAVGQLQRDLQPLGIAGGADGFANALARKDIVNFAHADGLFAGRLQSVQHSVLRRHKAVIVAAGGAGKVGGAVPHKGAGDDAPHAVFAHQQLTGGGADLVQFFHRNQCLVGGDLEHTVGGGVDDQRTGFQMLLAVVADDVRAGIGLVAQHLVAGLGGKGVQQLPGEAVREGGQRLGAEQPRNFPMPDGGVLAGAGFAQAGKAAQGCGGGGAALYAVDVE